MKCRLFAIASILCFLACAPAAFAEGNDTAQKNHFYIESNGGITFPLGFFSANFEQHDLMSYGAEFSAQLGLNFGGWLFGLEVSRDMWQTSADENNLFLSFNNNILMLQVRKVLRAGWIEFIPGLGVGVNSVNASYYTSTRAKEEGIVSVLPFLDAGGISVTARASFEIALWFGKDWIIPYVGADYNVFVDSLAGMSFVAFPRAYAGIRIYPRSIVRSAQERRERQYKETVGTWGPALASVTLSQKEQFVPSGTKDGALEISLSYEYLEYRPESWRVEILDADSEICAAWSGTGAVPKSVVWDGTVRNGKPLLSMQTYIVRLIIIPQENDRNRNGQQMIGVQSGVQTGIILADGTDSAWHIYFATQGEDEALLPQTYEALAKAVSQRGVRSVTVTARTASLAETVRQKLVELGCDANLLSARSAPLLNAAIDVIIER